MSLVLLLCVLAAAAWWLLTVAVRSGPTGRADSVDEFARALAALESRPPGRAVARPARARPRPPAGRTGR